MSKEISPADFINIQLREGIIAYRTGKYEVAKDFFRRALELNPKNHVGMGMLDITLARCPDKEETPKIITVEPWAKVFEQSKPVIPVVSSSNGKSHPPIRNIA